MKCISVLQLLRPAQWIKNLMLFFPPFLGGMALTMRSLERGGIAFMSFCLASSSMYVLNDLLDRDKDRFHPVKRSRPLAAGTISSRFAAALVFVLLVISAVTAWMTSLLFLLIIGVYAVTSACYSFRLKDIPVLDLFLISTGFILRLEAGGEAFGIMISDWLFQTVFLLSLFLSAGKRLSEKESLGEEAGNHRRSLERYPPRFLEGTMYVTAAAVLVTYTMYVITRHFLVFTVPLCTFGLLRYLFVVKSGRSGDPTESLLYDRQLFLVGIAWTAMVGWGIYGG